MATDADNAGLRAAERTSWQLTTRDDDPRRLTLPDGLDPADLLRQEGTAALKAAIEAAGHLADHLLDAHITATAHNSDPDGVPRRQ